MYTAASQLSVSTAGKDMEAYFANWTDWTGESNTEATELQEQVLRWDLTEPQYDGSPKTPDWARVKLPEWVQPFIGKNGMPPWDPAYQQPGSTCGGKVAGIDLYQANNFIVYRPETAAYLYSEYTPECAGYATGTLPLYEQVVAKYTDPGMTEMEKLLALLQKALPAEVRHPGTPPYAGDVRPDRAFMDEELLASGKAWCNEQARVLVRLCQVAGMQGRLIHLFGQHHTLSEIYVEGQWALVDASWYFVSSDDTGKLLSAADSHDRGSGQRGWALSRQRRMLEIGAMTAEEAAMEPEKWEEARKGWIKQGSDEIIEALANNDRIFFGVMNTPVPPPLK